MEKTRPILYGVSDYAELRRRNGWFIDRTAKIRDLEATHYAVFLRPRRFGKSLFTSILEAYYDVRYADRFDEFFAGTDIGANPTDERGKYLVLRFDFASITKDVDKVQGDFDYKASLQCDTFARNYRELLAGELADRILKAPDVGKKLATCRAWTVRVRTALPRRRILQGFLHGTQVRDLGYGVARDAPVHHGRVAGDDGRRDERL